MSNPWCALIWPLDLSSNSFCACFDSFFHSLKSCKWFSLLLWKVGTVQRGDICQHSSIVRSACQAGETLHIVSLRVWSFMKVYFTFSVKKSMQKDTCACLECRQHLPEAVWVTSGTCVRTKPHPSLLLQVLASALRNVIYQSKSLIWAMAELGETKLGEDFSGLPCLSWRSCWHGCNFLLPTSDTAA